MLIIGQTFATGFDFFKIKEKFELSAILQDVTNTTATFLVTEDLQDDHSYSVSCGLSNFELDYVKGKVIAISNLISDTKYTCFVGFSTTEAEWKSKNIVFDTKLTSDVDPLEITGMVSERDENDKPFITFQFKTIPLESDEQYYASCFLDNSWNPFQPIVYGDSGTLVIKSLKENANYKCSIGVIKGPLDGIFKRSHVTDSRTIETKEFINTDTTTKFSAIIESVTDTSVTLTTTRNLQSGEYYRASCSLYGDVGGGTSSWLKEKTITVDRLKPSTKYGCRMYYTTDISEGSLGSSSSQEIILTTKSKSDVDPLEILDVHIGNNSIAFDIKDANLSDDDQYFMECVEVGNELYTKNPQNKRLQINNNPSNHIQMMVGGLKIKTQYDCYAAVLRDNGQVIRHTEQKRYTTGELIEKEKFSAIVKSVTDTSVTLITTRDLQESQQYMASCVPYTGSEDSRWTESKTVTVSNLKPETKYTCRMYYSAPNTKYGQVGGKTEEITLITKSKNINITSIANSQEEQKENIIISINDIDVRIAELKKLSNSQVVHLKKVEGLITRIQDYNFVGDSVSDIAVHVEKFNNEITNSILSTEDLNKKKEVLERRFDIAKVKAIKEKFEKGIIPFSDTDDDKWYTEYVTDMKNKGVISGYKDESGKLTGEFKPGNNVTNAEVLKMALEMAGYGPSENSLLSIDHWAKGYIQISDDLNLDFFNIVKASPNARATRIEVVKLVLQISKTEIPDWIDYKFPDLKDTGGDGRYVMVANQKGIIDGYYNGTFQPYNLINRAETAKILKAAFDNL